MATPSDTPAKPEGPGRKPDDKPVKPPHPPHPPQPPHPPHPNPPDIDKGRRFGTAR